MNGLIDEASRDMAAHDPHRVAGPHPVAGPHQGPLQVEELVEVALAVPHAHAVFAAGEDHLAGHRAAHLHVGRPPRRGDVDTVVERAVPRGQDPLCQGVVNLDYRIHASGPP